VHGRILNVAKKKDQLKWKIGEKWDDLESLKKSLKDQKLPIILLVRGKGVLNKVVQNEHEDPIRLVEEMIPSGLIDDYYVNGIIAQKSTYGSIVRKGIIDEILSELNDFPIIDVFLGPQNLLILPLNIFNESTQLKVDNYSIENSENGDYFIEESNVFCPSYTVKEDGEEIQNDYLFCLSVGALFLFDFQRRISQLPQSVLINRSDNNYRMILKAVTRPTIFIIFIALVANFLFLNRLENKYEILITNFELNKEQSEMVSNLKKELNQREELFNKSGWGNYFSIAKVSDLIGNSIPKNILLEEMEIQPLINSIKEGNRIEFNLHSINIKGKAEDSNGLNDWISKLYTLEFVEKVSMEDYFIERGSEWATFSLNIIIN
jgi:hypothetical protein